MNHRKVGYRLNITANLKEMSHLKSKTVKSFADALLLLLKDRGVDYIFGNTGTDYPPLLASLERYRQAGELGQTTPMPITVPHENVAINMACGYYRATGRPQVVMVHTSVGTANLLCGLINSNRARTPLLVMAGKPSVTEALDGTSKPGYIHWAQDMFDQASMVREQVKWDYHLSSDNVAELELIVDRALTLAAIEPLGPTYLTFAVEAMAKSVEQFSYRPGPLTLTTPAHPDPHYVEQIANWLNQATYPLIVTGGTSRNPAIFEALQALVTDRTIPVACLQPRNLHIATTHPLYLGSNPHTVVSQADLIIVLDTDVPWIPLFGQPASNRKVVHIGSDPLFQRYPRRGYRCDIALWADPALALSAIRQAMSAPHAAQVRQRTAWAEETQKSAERHRQTQIEQARRDGLMNFGWISHCVGQVLDDETVMVREFDLQLDYLRRTHPGTYYSQPNAGGLGWGLGAALGVKLAEPERTVISVVGDGCYYFGNPTAAHAVANAQQLPFLTIVFNNAKWDTVVKHTNRAYPELETDDLPLTGLGPHPHFEKVVEAFGGYGERVEEPQALPGALERALVEVKRNKRQALLNIIC